MPQGFAGGASDTAKRVDGDVKGGISAQNYFLSCGALTSDRGEPRTGRSASRASWKRAVGCTS